jgi:hypothetical protein
MKPCTSLSNIPPLLISCIGTWINEFDSTIPLPAGPVDTGNGLWRSGPRDPSGDGAANSFTRLKLQLTD